jgi:hypothetical protein
MQLVYDTTAKSQCVLEHKIKIVNEKECPALVHHSSEALCSLNILPKISSQLNFEGNQDIPGIYILNTNKKYRF